MAETPQVQVNIDNLLRSVFDAGVRWALAQDYVSENDDAGRDEVIQATVSEFVKQSVLGKP